MSFKIKFSVFLLLLVICTVYCKTHEKVTSSTIFGPSEEVPMQNLPPNSCKVIAQIQQIHTIASDAKIEGPCDKTPCIASVKILKIKAYGSSFPTISTGDTLILHFYYTLTPSKKLFPEVSSLPPTLKTTDIIEGVITNKINMSQQSYHISSYTKVK